MDFGLMAVERLAMADFGLLAVATILDLELFLVKVADGDFFLEDLAEDLDRSAQKPAEARIIKRRNEATIKRGEMRRRRDAFAEEAARIGLSNGNNISTTT